MDESVSEETISDDIRFEVDRPVYTTKSLLESFPGLDKDNKRKFQRPQLSMQTFVNCFFNFFPVFRWLPEYKFKEWIIGDICSGITVGIVNIPQSIAFSILAGLAPIFGLYTSFYPVFMYFIMGTSRHLSIGSFAVLSLLTQGAVLRLAPEPTVDAIINSTTLAPNISTFDSTFASNFDSPLSSLTELEIKRIKIAATLTFLSGIFQLGFGLLRLGFLLSLLSPPIILALTTASAIYVTTSQMPVFFGITITKSTGLIQPIQDWIKIFSNLYSTHLPTFTISIVSFVVLLAGKIINDKFKSKLKVPLPAEIVVVVVAIISSYYGKFESKYNVGVVQNVPSGFPVPEAPDLSIISEVIADAFSVSIVGLAISVSLAKLYAERFDYEVDLNQEMVAYGAANFLPSFFFCFPSAAALARCEILVGSGGKTQVVGLVGFIVLLFTILFLGPIFEPLPKAILSSIIIVGLLGIMAQLQNIPELFRKSKLDFVIWLVTFSSIMIFSISLGLLIGVVFSIFTVILRTQVPKCEKLANIPETELYVNHKSEISLLPMDEILVFKFNAMLYFGNKDLFAKKLERKMKKLSRTDNMKPTNSSDEKIDFSVQSRDRVIQTSTNVKFIVVDCSSFSYLDLPAADLLKALWKKYKKIGVEFILVNVTPNARSMLHSSGYYQSGSDVVEYLTVHDAVLYCKSKSFNMETISENVRNFTTASGDE